MTWFIATLMAVIILYSILFPLFQEEVSIPEFGIHRALLILWTISIGFDAIVVLYMFVYIIHAVITGGA
jgi:hypothetical protein